MMYRVTIIKSDGTQETKMVNKTDLFYLVTSLDRQEIKSFAVSRYTQQD